MKSKFNKSLLFEVLSIQSKSENDTMMMQYLKNTIPKICKSAVVTEDEYGNIYVTKGKSKLYPCLVSHTDTVHAIHKDFKVYEQNEIIFAFSATAGEQVGVGGDDKCGVFICLNALQDLDYVKLVFFRNEEIGCLGSKKADMKFFDDCTIVCQADRRGHEGFVTVAAGVELSSKEFQKAIEDTLKEHSYKFVTGSITDVMTLKEKGLDICAFNIECAYYHPHSNSEIIHLGNLEDCYQTVFEIVEIVNLSKKRWVHKYEKKSYGTYYPKSSPYWRKGDKENKGGYDYTRRGELNFPVSRERERGDIIDNRRFSHFMDDKNLISDDPTTVNSYLKEQEDEERAVIGNNFPKKEYFVLDKELDQVEEEENEIELWENVQTTKADFDEAMLEYENYMLKKAELSGRI